MALLETLLDNFDDDSLDTGLWTKVENGTATVTETNKRLETAGPANGDSAYIYSNSLYDLTGSYLYIRVAVRSAAAFSDHRVQDTAGHWFQIRIASDGAMRLWYDIGAGEVAAANGASVTWNAVTHAWLRIRESGGTIYGDTAPSTGNNPPVSDWTNRWSNPTDAAFDHAACRAIPIHTSTSASQYTYWDGVNTRATAPDPFLTIQFRPAA